MQTMVGERRRPLLAAFIGYPGMGKTTQAKAMAAALGVPWLRLGRTMKDRGLSKTPEQADDPQLWYQKLLEFTTPFLREIVLPSIRELGSAVLDGFPRSQQEAEALVELAREHNLNLVIVHFDVPDRSERERLSLERQRSRAIAMGRSINDAWYWGKIRLAEQYEMTSLGYLRERGARIVSIDPRWPLSGVCGAVRSALRLGLETLPWDMDVLYMVRSIAPDAYVVGGHFYRPFFNGVYGPLQRPWNVGVAVGSSERVSDVRLALERADTRYRWRVGNATAFMRDKTGLPVLSLEDSLRLSHNLIGLSGGVRLTYDNLGKNRIEVIFGENAESHLRRGVLHPSANADPREAACKAQLLVRDYPGLSAPFIDHVVQPVIPDWLSIHQATVAMERGGKRHWSGLTPEECLIAGELLAFSRDAEKRPSAPPLPSKTKISSDPWNDGDASFKEYLLNYWSKFPHAEQDPLLDRVLKEVACVPQKPTHQGWTTEQHTMATLLQLGTEHLPGEYRRALRVAALFHDLGKKENVHTPGAHSAIGADKWRPLAPEWLPEEERALVTFLIAHHDVLGRLARGLKEPEFRGAVDPAYIRSILTATPNAIPVPMALKLILALNQADVSSVAALRWTVPELWFAARMVSSGF